MNTAFRRADLLSQDKTPYGTPVFPYVWKSLPEHKSVRLEMNQAENGDRRVASFTFDIQPGRPGVRVHVVVWIIKKKVPDAGDAVFPSHDTRLHAKAHVYFNLSLLNAPGEFAVSLSEGLEAPLPPPDDKSALPPPLP